MRRERWLAILVAILVLLPAGGGRTLAMPAVANLFDWERAVSLYKQGQYREAITEFELVLTEYPDHPDSLKFIGLCWFQLREQARAIEPLEKALELKRREGRNDVELIRALGQALLALNRYEQALPYLETITRLQLENAANHYLLGVAYANLNRPEEALVALRKSLQLNPRDGDTWYYIAARQFQAGQVREAVVTLRQGLAAAPPSGEMLRLLTESLLRLGTAEADEKLAQASFDEAVRIALQLRGLRDDAESTELLGRAYLGARRYPLAEQTLTRALALTPTPGATLCFNLGFVLARMKQWKRAVEPLTQASQLAPDDLNTLYYLGYVQENLRQYTAALEAYTRAWELGGRSNQELKASIERVTTALKQ
jgi:protein O-GlcNAc transferase